MTVTKTPIEYDASISERLALYKKQLYLINNGIYKAYMLPRIPKLQILRGILNDTATRKYIAEYYNNHDYECMIATFYETKNFNMYVPQHVEIYDSIDIGRRVTIKNLAIIANTILLSKQFILQHNSRKALIHSPETDYAIELMSKYLDMYGKTKMTNALFANYPYKNEAILQQHFIYTIIDKMIDNLERNLP